MDLMNNQGNNLRVWESSDEGKGLYRPPGFQNFGRSSYLLRALRVIFQMLKAIGISFHFSDTFPLGSTAFPEVVISLPVPCLPEESGAGGLRPLQGEGDPRGHRQVGGDRTGVGPYVMRAVGLRGPSSSVVFEAQIRIPAVRLPPVRGLRPSARARCLVPAP